MLKQVLFLSLSTILFSAPSGFQRIEGDAQISSSSAKLMEISCGQDAVIHWDSFSIGAQEALHFLQPSSDSVVVNRVVGSLPSQIDGALTALGQVYLLNPSGILFGVDARIDVGSLIASTLDVLKSSDQLKFSGNSNEALVNLGKIQAKSGDVVLAARFVKNDGTISAPSGDVLIASGLDITLSPKRKGQERIFVSLKGKEQQGTGVDQTGSIEALCAEIQSDGSLYELAINSTGIIDALSSEESNGVIHLFAKEGRLKESGTLQANGGTIHLLGEEVILEKGAHVDVSSLTQGDGGTVIVWGDQANGFFGQILAEGGPLGGDGGFVEISSPGSLAVEGSVSTLAPNGKTGTLYLDPVTVNITTLNANNTFSAPYYSFGAAPGASILNMGAGSLGTFLGTSNVIIDASGHGGTAAFGSITFSSAVTWASANTLTLIANDSDSSFVQFNANVTPTSAGFAAGANSIVIDAATINVGNGSQAVDILVTSTSGNISIDGDVYIIGGSTGDALLQAGVPATPASIAISGNVNILGGSPGPATATLRSRGANGNIEINGDLLMQGGVPNSGDCSALLRTDSTGSLTVNGNVLMQAGQEAATSNSNAEIDVGNEALINGNLTMNAGAATLGGSFENYFQADSVVVNGNLQITGGTSDLGSARAFIDANDGVTINGDVLLQGGFTTGSQSEVRIDSGSDGISIVGNVTLNGGTTTQAFGIAHAVMSTASGGGISIQGGILSVASGFGPGDTEALIETDGGNTNIIIDLTRDCTLTARDFSPASILVDDSGTISLNCRNLLMTSGSQATATTSIRTRSGDVNIRCTEQCTLNSLLGAPSTIRTLGSDLTVTAGGAITLLGPSSLAIVAPTGNLLAIAGTDFFIGSGASISISGIGSIDLVCDNQAPIFPEFGNGTFTLENGGTITNGGGGPVRIFTVTQSLNFFGNPINGFPFVAGPQFSNSNQEQWGVYYFNSFFGGPGFTIFYKLSPANSSLASISTNQMLWYLNPIGILCDSYFQIHRIDNAVTPLMRPRRFEQVGRIVTPPAFMDSPFVAQNFETTRPENLAQ